jgi:hypothetical protein
LRLLLLFGALMGCISIIISHVNVVVYLLL